MILVKPSYTIEALSPRAAILTTLEHYGRTCYKSEDRITDGSASKFCKMLLDRNHLSVIEHESMTVRFVCDRGVTHEMVRHRLASFSQESTRYCNYKGGVTFVIPPWIDAREGEWTGEEVREARPPNFCWLDSMLSAEEEYLNFLDQGWTPQQARCVLPNSTKSEIVMTANLREWIHVFNLRCSPAAHPQMRELMIPLRDEVAVYLPELFEANS